MAKSVPEVTITQRWRIPDGWAGVELLKRKNGVIYPHCLVHGAMNKVSKYGIWRCLMCHVGYDEKTGEVLKDSTEGFRK